MSGLQTHSHCCGGTLHLTEEPGTFRIHDTDVTVTHRFWRCNACGEELVTEELAAAVEKEAAAAYARLKRGSSGDSVRSEEPRD